MHQSINRAQRALGATYSDAAQRRLALGATTAMRHNTAVLDKTNKRDSSKVQPCIPKPAGDPHLRQYNYDYIYILLYILTSSI